MTDAQQEIEKLQEQIHKGAEETKTYLETVRSAAYHASLAWTDSVGSRVRGCVSLSLCS